jgi:DNA-binding GntR family transcriptional regulator
VELDHNSPTPLYVQLADLLRDQIERGELVGRVPSVKHLAQQYGVAIGTADRALGILRTEGLVVATVGRGHYTAPR